MADQTFRVVFAGGGSGGHAYPVIAVAEALQKKFTEEFKTPLVMTRIGPRDGYEMLFENHGIAVDWIVSAKLRRYFSFRNLVDIPKFFVGWAQALVKLYFAMPDIVFSKGGTGSLPVVLAAWWYQIPVVIHESDAKPGLANLVSSYFAKKIFLSFEYAKRYFNPNITEVVGTPERRELFAEKTTKDLAKDALGFGSSSPLTVIFCGSQGSQSINDFILANLPELIKETQLFHQTGTANFLDVEKLSHAALIDASYANRYQATGYFENNLGLVLTAADLVVGRAGSGTIFEIAAFGVPAILIPLGDSASNGHQGINAYEFAKGGAAIVIEEENLLPGIFLNQIRSILGNQDLRNKMSAASVRFFIPGAAETIVEGMIALCSG